MTIGATYQCSLPASSWTRGATAFAAAALTALVSACVALPPRPDDIRPSSAIPASNETRLARIAAVSTPPPPESGFRLLHSGTLALDARIALIRGAERSLDVQYYEIAADNTGRGFLAELRTAAGRGVRVRLLVDDLHIGDQQTELTDLASFPHMEVRVFNPLPVRQGSWIWRLLGSSSQVQELQMRMHNKLLVADGAFAITGGRNIADEYYWQSEESAFIDLDVVLAGSAVGELAALFDVYWNSEQVWPIESFAAPASDRMERRRRFDAYVVDARLPAVPRVPADRLGYGRLADEIEGGRVRLYAGRVSAVADQPHKVDESPFVGEDLWDAPSEIRRAVNRLLRGAERETMLMTPYFVPGESGIARMKANLARGVRIGIVTNSLASTDEPVVHAGYRRYRKTALEAGAELYELDPVPAERLALPEMRGHPVVRIHGKAAVIDRRIVYIGSMNFDPRSVALNTEIGVVIESAPLAHEVLELLEPLMALGSWQVRIGDYGELEWTRDGWPGDRAEPRTTLWQRMRLDWLSVLIPERSL